jgi:hypothetical protein
MFTNGKHRKLRAEVFKHYTFLILSRDVFSLLIALRNWADDDGNVDLDMAAFSKKCPLMLPQPSPDTMDSWIEVLVEAGHLHPYIVEGHRYASIDGFNDEAAPLFSSKPHPKEATKWRNPTPEETNDVPEQAIQAKQPAKRIRIRRATDDDGSERNARKRHLIPQGRSRVADPQRPAVPETPQKVVEAPKKRLPRTTTPKALKIAQRSNESRLRASPSIDDGLSKFVSLQLPILMKMFNEGELTKQQYQRVRNLQLESHYKDSSPPLYLLR